MTAPPYSSETLNAPGSKCGVTPALIGTVELNAPKYNTIPAPDAAVPIVICVAVADPDVHVPKSTAATFDTTPELTTQPNADLGTGTRAYPVYDTSYASCVPSSPGSATCNAKYKFVLSDAHAGDTF